MRKPRTDSTLDWLPDDQREQLMDWILGRVSYRQIVERMRDLYQVETSIRSISEYWRKYGAEHWKVRRQGALQMARDVVAEAQSHPGEFSEAAVAALEEKVFALAMDPEGSVAELKGIVTLLIKRQDQEMRRRDLELSRERLAFDREKFRETMKSGIEKGLDALFDEIEGNAEAEALFIRLKATVISTVEQSE